MTVYFVIATMSPECLCPMLLLCEALPVPARTTPPPTQLQIQAAIEDAKKAFEKEQPSRRIAFALLHDG